MTCHSGGMLEIYVEPFLPAPELVVTGDSPLAEALATLGGFAGYRVHRGMSADTTDGGGATERYVIVAGMSGEDEADLERAIAMAPRYLGFVGSRKRLADVRERLRERGVPSEQLERVKGPAGLDIRAVTPVEIAISILAEITLVRRGEPMARPGPLGPVGEADPAAGSAEATDPVCGMRVAVLGARHVLELGGRRFYFCCPACKRTFAEEPERYLVSVQSD